MKYKKTFITKIAGFAVKMPVKYLVEDEFVMMFFLLELLCEKRESFFDENIVNGIIFKCFFLFNCTVLQYDCVTTFINVNNFLSS